MYRLPAPRPVLWPLRPIESARCSVIPRDGRTVITVQHAPLRGVTPEMLSWWYRHVPGEMAYAGSTYSRYLVWHPLDHIDYVVTAAGKSGGVSPGARLHITEALQRDMDNLLDIRVTVMEMYEGCAVVAKKSLGTSIVRLVNEFAASPGGASYVTTMTIGDDTALGNVALNRVAHRKAFPPRRIGPWMRHHVEEIGNLEHFLPDLFADRSRFEP
jgi:DAPG hydrolase PhiG domain